MDTAPDPGGTAARRPSLGRLMITYTALRMGLLLIVLALLYAAGAKGLLLAVLGVGISLALSYLLLRRQRDELALRIAEQQARRLPAEGAPEAVGREAVEREAVEPEAVEREAAAPEAVEAEAVAPETRPRADRPDPTA